jgi:signal transduction histidine kinase
VPLKLRDRILGWSIATTLIIVLVVVVLVDSIFRTTIRQTLEESLGSGARLAGELHRSTVDDWITDVARVALEPTLRASLETSDPATIGQLLDTARANVRADWLAVVSPEGDLLAASGPVPTARLASSQPLIDETRDYDSGDLWVIGDTLVQVGASSVLFGELRLGVLLGGNTIDDARASELANGTGENVAFLAGSRLAAVDSLVAGDGAPELAAIPWGDELGQIRLHPDESDPTTISAVREFELGDERFLGTPLSLHGSDTRRVGSLVVFRSLDAALGPVRRLRIILLGVAVGGLVIGLIMSMALTQSVAEPVRRLLVDTVRLGSGNLEQPIQPMERDEIGMLADGFERMRVSLRDARAELIHRERLSAIGTAASAIVHDFAQPIMVISAHSELLGMPGADEEQRKQEVAGIRDAIKRVNAMMREVLEFARGEVRIDKTSISVRSLLEDVARQAKPVVATTGIVLEVSHGYAGDWVLDQQRTSRALGNLVRNAAAVLEQSGGKSIALRSERANGRLRLEVADDGPGIPDQIKATLFEPFVTRGKREGTGLGLAIVKNIAESQGGTASFTTSPQGTVFVIELPEAKAREVVG